MAQHVRYEREMAEVVSGYEQRVSEYKQILREYKQTIREYECRQSLAAKTIFELSREVRRLEKELSKSQKVVTMRREQVKNLKDANKSLRKLTDFYIEREKDNQGFC